MEKILRKLPECNLQEKKLIFDKIIRASDISLEKKRDIVKKILIKIQDKETQELARYVYHTLNEQIEKEQQIFIYNPDEILDSDDSDKKIALLKQIRVKKMIENKKFIKKFMVKEKDPFVKATMISTLGEIGAEDDANDLISFLNDRDPRIRANAVEALTMLDNEKTFKNIISLVEDEDARVKANVAEFMKSKNTYDVIEVLKKMVYSNNKREIHSAIYVLKRIDKKKTGNLLPLAEDRLTRIERNDKYNEIKEQIKEKTDIIKPEIDNIKDKITTGFKNLFKKK
ncbi:MAG: HEAT repeat domain-containing protein [Candidatus Muiribacteriota bacterium]